MTETETATPKVYRVACLTCGQRIWGSGLGVGAHRKRNCQEKGNPR